MTPLTLFTLLCVIVARHSTQATPFIVQTLSSRFALVLGGYGPGYTELKRVEVVKHDKVCLDAVR